MLIRGVVRDAGGRPIEWAVVSFVEAPVDVPDIAAATDADGGFVVSAPAPGRYRLGVRADGHDVHELTVEVTGDVDVAVDLGVAEPERGGRDVAAELPMISWTSVLADREDDDPDIAVFPDGRLRLGPRFGGGETAWHQLAAEDTAALHALVFEAQAFEAIDGAALDRDIASADAHELGEQRDDATRVAIPPRDASTIVFRSARPDRPAHEVRVYDLAGTTQRHPEIPSLQQLHAIQARLLELAAEHDADRGS